MFNEENFPFIIGGVIVVISLFILFTAWKHDEDVLSKEYYVTLSVDYCNGKSDTVYVYIKGNPKYLHIKNDSHSKYSHLAVPELIGYGGLSGEKDDEQRILLNVCSFKIINSQQIK